MAVEIDTTFCLIGSKPGEALPSSKLVSKLLLGRKIVMRDFFLSPLSYCMDAIEQTIWLFGCQPLLTTNQNRKWADSVSDTVSWSQSVSNQSFVVVLVGFF